MWVWLGAAIIAWIVPTILVEGRLFDRPRDWCINQGMRAWHAVEGWHKLPWVMPEGTTADEAALWNVRPYKLWGKLAQLVTCQLCLRVWVGFACAAYFGGPDHGWARLIANGLMYAGAGHFIFELRSKIALVEKPS